VSAMENDSNKLTDETIARLRILAHDLSNAIETVMQASYLMAQSELDVSTQKWLQMIDTASQEAASINRTIREILRSQGSSNPLPPSA
jgi:light-regulated signal transduction histidine kinase (bacteriophytochrome)